QIKAAFDTAQHEVDFLRQRTAEGVRRAQMEGKRVGAEKGAKLITKKSVQAKEIILQNSRSFMGTMSDADLIDLLKGKLGKMSRNTFYKYKKELDQEHRNA
ncbi:MAG: recombinase family protein, partial [Mogibacterium sp.]|nr:recombinase family protein [Mogibacterium sp.]